MLLKDSERQALEAANVALGRAASRAVTDANVTAQEFALLASALAKFDECAMLLGIDFVRDAAA